MMKDFEQLSLNLSQGHPLYDKIFPKHQPLRLINETYQAILSVSDPEAKIVYKSKTEAFAGYKSHIAITEERIITVIEVNEVLADAAYSIEENLPYMEQENIIAVTSSNKKWIL